MLYEELSKDQQSLLKTMLDASMQRGMAYTEREAAWHDFLSIKARDAFLDSLSHEVGMRSFNQALNHDDALHG